MKRFNGVAVFCIFVISLLLVGCQQNDAVSIDGELNYPTKEIKLVYHSREGSGGDVFLRNTARPLEKILGVPVVVENRTGAGGANAWNYVLNSKADGYTLLGTTATLVSSPILSNMDISYKDFTPVAQLFLDPAFLYVNVDSPFNTIDELFSYEKENPGNLSWATSTPGSKDTITLALISEEVGIKARTVAFEGGSEALIQIVGGHIDVGIGEYSYLQSQVEAGQIKILASITEERHPLLEDIPTLKERGWEVAPYSPRAIMAPPDLPEDIQQILIDAIEKAFEDPDFQTVWESDGVIPSFAPGMELMEIYEEMDKFTRPLLE